MSARATLDSVRMVQVTIWVAAATAMALGIGEPSSPKKHKIVEIVDASVTNPRHIK